MHAADLILFFLFLRLPSTPKAGVISVPDWRVAGTGVWYFFSP
jgi:hypothetical protein